MMDKYFMLSTQDFDLKTLSYTVRAYKRLQEPSCIKLRRYINSNPNHVTSKKESTSERIRMRYFFVCVRSSYVSSRVPLFVEQDTGAYLQSYVDKEGAYQEKQCLRNGRRWQTEYEAVLKNERFRMSNVKYRLGRGRVTFNS
ncbi:hypothetical protein JTE90_005487 [Oedothorax gibbosus]|uniref:Uncharacterized protein n=1 Tax=Oedothorax gibbosus TaxID=931172 RepID=A0AAV6UP52_9ARAC|nr:hypothetical protein JTE90_005487 [Oedothorax gibbosus]